MAPASEFELIERFRERLPLRSAELRTGSGDDAAVTEPRRAAATSVDAIAEGVHFVRPQFPPEAIGRKALAAALSDLAGMGADPAEAYVVIGVPNDTPDDDLLAIADGLGQVAEREGVVIAGGDLTGARGLFLAVTVVGTEPKESRLVERGGARPRDVVALTGAVGGAAAALSALRSGARADPRLLARQLDPVPRLAAGRLLSEAGATAMIDVSDGLYADAGHLAKASGVALELRYGDIPADPALSDTALDPSEVAGLVLAGGEDYELLVTFPGDEWEPAQGALARAGVELSAIGSVKKGAGVTVSGAPAGVELAGYDHRRGS